MALAPTLYLERAISVGVGAVALAGLSVTTELGTRSPTQGTVTIAGNIPTVSVQLGPTADADVGELMVVGQIPFLQRILIIAPGLPDTEPELNDLTPTLVWQETPLPGVGAITMAGLAPAVVGDTGQSIAVSVGSAIIAGLAPTLSIPAGQEGATAPDKAELAIAGLVPTLYLELTFTPDQGALGIAGLVPTLLTATGWTTVDPAQNPGWSDVPTV